MADTTPPDPDTLVEVVDSPDGPLALKPDEAFALSFFRRHAEALAQGMRSPSDDEVRALAGIRSAITAVGRLRRDRLAALADGETLADHGAALDPDETLNAIGTLMDRAVAHALEQPREHAAAFGPGIAGLVEAYTRLDHTIPKLVAEGEAIPAAPLFTVDEVAQAIRNTPGVGIGGAVGAFEVADAVAAYLREQTAEAAR